ncbi:hypothetical protein LX32DRAFT_272868 [Colletotrichum zoysiae]|uniref:Secreted protein n=1 Tax=Colletotrichum zoysiae TaxID=1216348 RepID=A0AAD9M383_9PEZI|nr:hypothetical protein LX32DRAFT_272868 [Colletotrichum zoysiae]
MLHLCLHVLVSCTFPPMASTSANMPGLKDSARLRARDPSLALYQGAPGASGLFPPSFFPLLFFPSLSPSSLVPPSSHKDQSTSTFLPCMYALGRKKCCPSAIPPFPGRLAPLPLK